MSFTRSKCLKYLCSNLIKNQEGAKNDTQNVLESFALLEIEVLKPNHSIDFEPFYLFLVRVRVVTSQNYH